MLNKEKDYRLRPEVQDWLEEARKVLLGKDEALCLAFISVLSRGHLLIEDVPGVGKTTLVYIISKLFNFELSRIQFTNDLLPSDIIGINIFQKEQQTFLLKKGPLFGELILADELNRATPKTQSALLQGMEERKVSLDGEEFLLPENFIVMATQNPMQQIGTYPLPESQLDRFFMSIEMGFPHREYEKVILHKEKSLETYQTLHSILSKEELIKLQKQVKDIHVNDKLTEYILDLLKTGREQLEQARTLSMRAGKDLLRATQAMAWLRGRDYATADDVQFVLPSVWGHRLGGSKGILFGQQLARSIIEKTPLDI